MGFRNYCSNVILITTLLISVVAGDSAGTPRQLGRILYGQHSEQIGVNWAGGGLGEGNNPYNLGPIGFAVDDQGDIYLGDYVNGSVKRFSKKGELLAVTEGVIGNLQSFWVSSTGDLYVRSEDRPSEITRFDSRGHRVWARTFHEIIPRDVLVRLEQDYGVKFPSGFSTEITIGPKNTIMLQATGQLTNGQTGKKIGIIVNDKGEFVEVRPYFGFESGGFWWQYQIDFTGLADGVSPPITVNTYTKEGTKKQTISLDVKVDATRYQHLSKYSSIWAIPDRRNGNFLITTIKLVEPIKVTQQALIHRDYIVDRYDNVGKFIERFRFAYSPFQGSFENITVSSDGVLYFLRYDNKGLYVMTYE